MIATASPKTHVAQPQGNLLPSDGEAFYLGRILTAKESRSYFDALLETIAWKHDTATIFGKQIVTARKVAWYGDQPYAYTYSGSTKEALPWTAELRELKARVESVSNAKFNSCLLNLYRSGNEGMSWHSDDEKMLTPRAPIASLSLGAERTFSFKHRTNGQKATVILEDGSLLIMAGATQEHWLHSLPKSARVNAPRINLTFRIFATL